MSYPSRHKGWRVDYDAKPIPYRGADWIATSPDYDCDCDQDGFYVCSGSSVSAGSYEELIAQIDEAEAELDQTETTLN